MQLSAIWAAMDLKLSPLNAKFKTEDGRVKRARKKKKQNEKELIPLSGKWAEPAPVSVGGRARARARAR